MKTKHLVLSTALLSVSGISLTNVFSTDPEIPTGSLSAYPTIVQTGTHPTLTWSITHPEVIDDVVDIDPPGTTIPKETLIMDIRVVGASVKRVWLDRRGRVTDWEWVPTECKFSYNNGSYQRIFYDTQDDVNPDQVVYSRTVYKDKPLNFGGRYLEYGGGWSTFYSSTNCDHNVIALKNGDNPPDVGALYGQDTVEDFLRPYMDNQGNISIGPKDVIYLVELTHTNMNDGGFDLQDLVILATFRKP
ncbi:MAG: hypothetical protein KDM91_05520 [Verrucomicrobiae bacterium]|nr:hypothetical protein [Verrucomicrobiae bacterium]MCP5540527.1 hypothetical protein [Akkermansiaceae bacterium]MCP5550791.1 hypothetical protein [Akkermansiaceae bacterium]